MWVSVHAIRNYEQMLKAVTVNFNSGRRLSECARGLLDEPLINEIIVVDNASADDSLNHLHGLIGQPTRLKIFTNESNKGFAAAVNHGVKTDTTADWLIINPDCMIDSETVGEMI